MYLLLLVIDFPDNHKTINCKKRQIKAAFETTQHNSLKNLNQFINKFPKTFYSVCIKVKCGNVLNVFTYWHDHLRAGLCVIYICLYNKV